MTAHPLESRHGFKLCSIDICTTDYSIQASHYSGTAETMLKDKNIEMNSLFFAHLVTIVSLSLLCRTQDNKKLAYCTGQ